MLMRTREENLKLYTDDYEDVKPFEYSSEWERILDTAYEYCDQLLKERVQL